MSMGSPKQTAQAAPPAPPPPAAALERSAAVETRDIVLGGQDVLLGGEDLDPDAAKKKGKRALRRPAVSDLGV